MAATQLLQACRSLCNAKYSPDCMHNSNSTAVFAASKAASDPKLEAHLWIQAFPLQTDRLHRQERARKAVNSETSSRLLHGLQAENSYSPFCVWPATVLGLLPIQISPLLQRHSCCHRLLLDRASQACRYKLLPSLLLHGHEADSRCLLRAADSFPSRGFHFLLRTQHQMQHRKLTFTLLDFQTARAVFSLSHCFCTACHTLKLPHALCEFMK